MLLGGLNEPYVRMEMCNLYAKQQMADVVLNEENKN